MGYAFDMMNIRTRFTCILLLDIRGYMKRLLAGMVLPLLLSGCASVNSKIYKAEDIKTDAVWSLDFAYDTGSVEQMQKSGGESEVKVVSKGQLPSDLQLRDDVFFLLQDDYAVTMTKNAEEATGKILIHPLHFYSGGFKQVTVTFVNKQEETVARIKVENGDRNATFKDDDGFAKYTAKAIAKVIRHE